MKKFGFTLAEILITLGIIGVVAALTAPTLVNDSANAQIGPKLAKTVSTLEQANMAIINGQSSNNREVLDSLADLDNIEDYTNALLGQISGSSQETRNAQNDTLRLKGGITISFSEPVNTYPRTNNYRGSYLQATIDLNARRGGNAILGVDEFLFMVDANGTVLPFGGQALNQLNSAFGLWRNTCLDNNTNTRQGCAGSIFENNMKVIYR